MFFKFYKLILLFIMTMLFMSSWSTVNAASTDDDCTAAKAMAADLFLIDATKINDSSEGANSCYNFFSLGSHAGIDLQTQDVAGDKTADRKFYALEDGEVVFTGGKYGDVAIYNDNKKTVVSYLHARKINPDLKVGISRVKKGDYLGVQGNVMPTSTDTTSNEHVHVEVLKLASKPVNRTTTLTKDATSTSTDLVNPLEYFGYKKSCKSSNTSTATVTSVTVSRVEDGTNFSKDSKDVFQLKSLRDNTNYKISLSGDNFIDDGGCSNITVKWKFANEETKSLKTTPVSSNDKIEFTFGEGSGVDRFGKWEFTVYKNNTSIANIKATTNMDAISPAVSSCFSDMQGLNDDKKKALCSLKSQGVISGYGASGEVKPHDLINRAEFSKIISVDHNGDELNESWDCTDADNKFYDVLKKEWWCKYVKYASSKEIVSGYSAANTPCKKENDQNYDSKNYFCPGGNITYQESLKMIFKSIFSLDNGWVGDPSVLYSNDAPFNSYVGCARDLKLLGEGFVFKFNSTIQRGDVFLALYNARQLIESTENSNKKLTFKSNSACIFE